MTSPKTDAPDMATINIKHPESADRVTWHEAYYQELRAHAESQLAEAEQRLTDLEAERHVLAGRVDAIKSAMARCWGEPEFDRQLAKYVVYKPMTEVLPDVIEIAAKRRQKIANALVDINHGIAWFVHKAMRDAELEKAKRAKAAADDKIAVMRTANTLEANLAKAEQADRKLAAEQAKLEREQAAGERIDQMTEQS